MLNYYNGHAHKENYLFQALPLPFLGTAFSFLLQMDCKDRQK